MIGSGDSVVLDFYMSISGPVESNFTEFNQVVISDSEFRSNEGINNALASIFMDSSTGNAYYTIKF